MGAGHNPAQGHHGSASRSRVNLWSRLLALAPILWLFNVVVLYMIARSFYQQGAPKPPLPAKRNVIFMVSDGMGPASLAMARNFYQYTHNTGLDTLALDDAFIGNSRTQSSSSFITDSAAGATAFSCGLKTYNGAIGVDSDARPCATILEAAKLGGYRTGLVVTTRITDATPACFASHAHDRSEEDYIAEQLVNWQDAHPFGETVDLILGGGRCHFLPRGTPGSCREDGKNLVAGAQSRGWHYVEDISGFHDLELGNNVSLPLLGLFAPGDLPFSIDYHEQALPRLNETALTAANALADATKDSEQGFFLLVEGSRIDHAGHSNDAGAQVHEVIAYSEAFEAIQKFASESDVPTIVVSTSDHETGGLAVARQISEAYPDYLWYPEVLSNAKHSVEYVVKALHQFEGTEKELLAFIQKNIVGSDGLGLKDVTDEEITNLANHKTSAHDQLSRMQAVRAQIGWSTHGHSAVDVNVYGTSNYPEVLNPLRGPNENIDIGHFMRDFLGFGRKHLHDLTVDLRQRFGQKFDA